MKTYTFQVSLPEYGEVSRTVELPADLTLEDLHFAIQDVFQFDAAHLYSFFMSGKAWDTETEYALPDDADPLGLELWDEDEEDEATGDAGDAEEEGDGEAGQGEDALPMPDGLELRAMFDALKADPALLSEAREQITRQTGLPAFLFDMILQNSDAIVEMADNPQLFEEGDDELESLAGDVRETTLGSLNLRKGKRFLYLFDYGDEWRFQVKVIAVNQSADPDAGYPRLVASVGDAPEQYGDLDEDEEDLDEEEADS